MHTQHLKHTTQSHFGPTRPTTTTPTAVTSGDKDRNAPLVSTADIRLYAYRKWESAGMPTGDGIQFWLEAEQELVSKTHATSTHDHSQDADRHSKTRHPHSQK
jgi:Protein of unknown function (DUF2934)